MLHTDIWEYFTDQREQWPKMPYALCILKLDDNLALGQYIQKTMASKQGIKWQM